MASRSKRPISATSALSAYRSAVNLDPAGPPPDSSGTSTTVSSGSFNDEGMIILGGGLTVDAITALGLETGKIGGVRRDGGNTSCWLISAAYQFSSATRPPGNRKYIFGSSGVVKLSVNMAVLDETETDAKCSFNATVPRTTGGTHAATAGPEVNDFTDGAGISVMTEGVLETGRTDIATLAWLAPLKLRFLSLLLPPLRTKTSIVSNR